MPEEAPQRLRRALRQQLETLRRAGVTRLPRHRPAKTAHGASARPALQGPAAAAGSAVPPRVLFADEAAPGDRQRSSLTRVQREERLRELAECVASCTRCRELAETRTQTVFGVGNPQARLMFIGEAPGADEDRLGEPFVGKAGQLLNRIIQACKLKREDVYICNVLRCRPPGNRTPTKEEADNCREFLDAQIRIVDPEYIVCWGSVAAQNLLGVETSIGRMRQKFYNYGRAKVVCTYHPSYLLRNPGAKKDVWEDMKFLFRDMGVDLESPSR